MQAGLIGLALALPAAPTPAQTRVREIHNQRLPVIRPLFAPIVEVSRRILSNTLMRMQPRSHTPNPGSLSGLASRSSTSTGPSPTGDSMHLASPCEVDCQPAICVRRILVTNRWILAISMCGAKYLAGGAHPQKDVLVIACAAALITVAVVHLGLRIRILPMLELSCATTALGCISFVGFRAAAAALASPDFPALVLAVTCAAGAAYCVRRIVSPGASDLSRASVTRILSHGSAEERNMGVDPLKTAGWSLRLLVALLSTFTLVPDGQLGPFTSIAAGTGAFWWLATSTIPAIWKLLESGATPLLDVNGPSYSERKQVGYWTFVMANSRNRLGAAVWGVVSIGLMMMWCSFFLFSLIAVRPEGSAVGLYFFGAASAWCYRKARTTLKSGVRWNEVGLRLKDEGAFTLYLRSFEDDQFQFDSIGDWGRLLYVPLAAAFAVHVQIRRATLESMIVRALWPYRSVLSVAPPLMDVPAAEEDGARRNESVHGQHEYAAQREIAKLPASAVRLCVSPESWQSDVLDLARKAELVVVVPARTTGLRWEFDALSHEPALRRKLLLVIPPETPIAVLDRWLAFSSSVSRTLAPDVLARTLAIRLTADRDVLFTADERSVAAYTYALELARAELTSSSRPECNATC